MGLRPVQTFVYIQTMPVQTSPSFQDFPAFTGFGGPLLGYEKDSLLQLDQYPTHVPVDIECFSPHRKSVSSMTSCSNSSSETTSPITASSGGPYSPNSSPESVSAMSTPYAKTIPSRNPLDLARPPTLDGPLATLQRNPSPDAPTRRARNLKNLSLRMTPPSQSQPAIATASVLDTRPKHHFVGRDPPKTAKRRPANLTIQTPTLKSFTSDVIPQTPSLKHAEGSSSLAGLGSPSFAPSGGMRLPNPISQLGPSLSFIGSAEDPSSRNDASGISCRVLNGLPEEDDGRFSRESLTKARGYPEGPIQIHDAGVYLYLEPTAEEAAQFDVVINVAKEVANPFSPTKEKNDTVMSTWRNASMASKRLAPIEPPTAVSELSFKSALEFQPSDSESGTPTISTPRSAKSAKPEYLHVPWDHNSEILEDLLPLCELIDDRVAEGKKILVHCQLGASRSASLVIAYGLYKNRQLDFNSMYEAVKSRSQWVGPNMSLIYQLTDFRSKLLRGSTSKPLPKEWFVQTGRRCSEPQVARAERPPTRESNKRGFNQGPSMSCLSIPEQTSTPMRPSTSSGPLPSPKRSLTSHPLLFRKKFQSVEPTTGRPRGLPRSVSSCDPLVQTHVFVRDAPDAGGLFSPRTDKFLFPKTLAPPSVHRIDRSPVPSPPSILCFAAERDPRSPPSLSETSIMRSIDECL